MTYCTKICYGVWVGMMGGLTGWDLYIVIYTAVLALGLQETGSLFQGRL